MTEFWAGLLQIVAIDVLLGGDNAVVIALACRDLPEEQRKKAMRLGVIGAIGARIALLFFAFSLLKVPYLKLVAALFLFWIGVNLLGGEAHKAGIRSQDSLFSAIRTIILADTVMSVDNIIGVAGAARDNFFLIVLGISISVPVVLWGSGLVLKMMDRFPALILLGAGLIGWIAGEMFVSDKSLGAHDAFLSWAVPAASALLTVLIGKWRASGRAGEFRDLAESGDRKGE